MPKILCSCGKVLSYGEIPSPIDYLFISDVEYDKYQENIDPEELYSEMKNFLKCTKCGHLWVFWNGFDHEPEEYVPVP